MWQSGVIARKGCVQYSQEERGGKGAYSAARKRGEERVHTVQPGRKGRKGCMQCSQEERGGKGAYSAARKRGEERVHAVQPGREGRKGVRTQRKRRGGEEARGRDVHSLWCVAEEGGEGGVCRIAMHGLCPCVNRCQMSDVSMILLTAALHHIHYPCCITVYFSRDFSAGNRQ